MTDESKEPTGSIKLPKNPLIYLVLGMLGVGGAGGVGGYLGRDDTNKQMAADVSEIKSEIKELSGKYSTGELRFQSLERDGAEQRQDHEKLEARVERIEVRRPR